jgi:general secretion pathway protein I
MNSSSWGVSSHAPADRRVVVRGHLCGRVAFRLPIGRRGLSLFEVLISLAIFLGSLAIIAQLVDTGVRGAVRARLQSQAIIRCESKLAEVVSGAIPFQQTGETPFPDDPAWRWSVALLPGPYPDLYIIEVTTTHHVGNDPQGVSFALQRMIRDPQVFLDAMIAQEQAAANTSVSTTGGGQ